MTASLIVCIGIPASGKSTWAKAQPDAIVVSRDQIRLDVFGVVFDPSVEHLVGKVHNKAVVDGLRDGQTVIVDNCNLKGKYRNDLKKLCIEAGVPVLYKEVPFLTDVDVCRERNNKRQGNKVPDDVFNKFVELAKPWYNGKMMASSINFEPPGAPPSPPPYDSNKGDCIVCDLDGTLCNLNGRDPYDPSTCDRDLPVYPVLDCLNAMYAQGKDIVFMSGREDKYRNQTMKFLSKYTTFPSRLLMRATDDKRKDSIVKRELYETELKSKYNVIFVIDDRPSVVRMWRYDLGFMVFQVNDREF